MIYYQASHIALGKERVLMLMYVLGCIFYFIAQKEQDSGVEELPVLPFPRHSPLLLSMASSVPNLVPTDSFDVLMLLRFSRPRCRSVWTNRRKRRSSRN